MVEQKNGSVPITSPEVIAHVGLEKGLFSEYPGILHTIDYLSQNPNADYKKELTFEGINAWVFGKNYGKYTYSIDTVFYYLNNGHPGLSESEINHPEFKKNLVEMANEEIYHTMYLLELECINGKKCWQTEEERLKAAERAIYLHSSTKTLCENKLE